MNRRIPNKLLSVLVDEFSSNDPEESREDEIVAAITRSYEEGFKAGRHGTINAFQLRERFGDDLADRIETFCKNE